MPVGVDADVEDGARVHRRRARPGDVVLTVGAGDVDARRCRSLLGGSSRERSRSASRSPVHDARHRRPGALRSRGRRRSTSSWRLLALGGRARRGRRRDRARLEPARRRRGRRRARAQARGRARGGRASTARPARRRRRCAERGLPAPRPCRGARRVRVRLRDPRHDRRRRVDERRRLRGRLLGDARARARRRRRRRALAHAGRARARVPALGARAAARSSRRSSFGSCRARRSEIKATVAELQAQRKAAQPTNKRTFGSVFKNPEHELGAGRMLEACGLQGPPDRRGADLAAARELHRERRRRTDAPTRWR